MLIRLSLLSSLLIVFSAPVLAEDSPFDTGTVTVELTDNDVRPEEESITVPYRLLSPPKIEEGKTYPLVVFLHGAGERGSDNQSQLKYLPRQMAEPEWREKFPCFLLAPQCPKNRKWVEVPWGGKTVPPMPETASAPMRGVEAMIQQVLQTKPIDSSRVLLTGLSMGGYGSYDLAARHPDWFAAVAPICGGFDPSQVEKLRGLPIRIYHGDKDRAVPVERSRKVVAALKKAGIPFEYTEYAGAGHNVWDRAYGEEDGLIAWLFSQRKANGSE